MDPAATAKSGLSSEIGGDIDIVKRIKIQRLRWLGPVVGVEEFAPARKVFESKPGGGSRRRGRTNHGETRC